MAQLEGVELIVCKMTIDMMELNEDELVEGAIVWNGRGVHQIRQRLQDLSVYLNEPRPAGAVGMRGPRPGNPYCGGGWSSEFGEGGQASCLKGP